ncbi:MAG: S8 family serine peptidase [Myxococcales bacterium]|nr:S8 family serine peptidase [Myxococcales bacterium]
MLWQAALHGVSPTTPQLAQVFSLPFLHLSADPDDPQVRVLLHASASLQQDLQQQGISLTAPSNGIAAAWLSPQRLQELLQRPPSGLYALASSPQLRPHLNLSAPLVGAPQARTLYGLDGRGVIVAVVDSGIDLQHPAFRNSDGTTRVLALLDYSLPATQSGRAPRLFLKKELDLALQSDAPLLHQDLSGHGTHVAGIAAGNGKSTDGQAPYMGIAPRADLVIVKALRKGQGEFDSGDLLESIAFIHQFAKLYRKPYVLNMSLGGHQGPHDGSSLLEKALSAYAGPRKEGQILVASAGNEGDREIYWGGWAHPDAPAEIQLKIPGQDSITTKDGGARVVIEFWSDAQAELAFSIHAPNGQEVLQLAANESTKEPIESEVGTLMLTTRKDGDPAARRLWVLLLSNTEKSPLLTGTWKIQAKGTASPLHVWVAQTRLPTGGATLANSLRMGHSVAMPGTSPFVITVGSYNTRSAWETNQGKLIEEDIPLGASSSFSSLGPTPDGRPKPDISAPGQYITSAGSQEQSPSTRTQVTPDDYRISQGTSQAAPHVTGAIALLLQLDPTLDLENTRNILTRSARADNRTSQQLYHPAWGFGKLDIMKAIQTLKKQATSDPDPKQSGFGILHQSLPADGLSETTLFLVPKDRDGIGLSRDDLIVRVETDLGEIVGSVTGANEKIYQLRLRAPQTPGQATLHAWINNVPLEVTPTITFLPYPKKHSFFGCQTMPSPPLWSLAWLCLLLFLRRRTTRPQR